MNQKRTVLRLSRAIEISAAIIIVLCFLWNIGLILTNLPATGSDARDHLSWLRQFIAQVDSGTVYPRWTGDSFAGLGLPVFYFYPPLAFYCAWFVHCLTQSSDPNRLYNLTSVLFLGLSLCTTYLYVRRYDRTSRAVVATLLTAILPYRYFQHFLRNAFSEQLVMVWLPLVFWLIDHALENPVVAKDRWRLSLAAATLSSVLILTNLPALAMLALTLPIYMFFRVKGMAWKVWSSRLLPGLAGVVLSLAMCGFYLLPLRELLPLLHLDLLYQPTDLLRFPLSALTVNRSNLFFSLAMMSVVSILIVAGYYYSRERRSDPFLPWFWVSVVIAFLQIPYISTPIWHYFPLLGIVQTAGRWGVLLTLSTGVMFVTLRNTQVRLWLVPSLMCLILLTNIHGLSSIRSTIAAPPPILNDRFAMEYVPRHVTAWEQAWTLRTSGLMPDAAFVDSSASRLDVKRSLAETRIHYKRESGGRIRFARFFWPAWQLTERTDLPLGRDSLGLIQADLPAGEHTLTLHLAETPSEMLGKRISMVGFALFVAACCAYGVSYIRHRKNSR